jgi:CRP/FNR family transcriptional regulator, dissimilatory nitrate respiration regulator
MVEDVYSVLRESRLLRSASDAGLRRMAEAAKVRTVAKGELVTAEGQAADGFGFILSGTVPSYQISSDGRRLLFTAGDRGDDVGLAPAVAGSRYPFYFEATTKAAIAWFPRSALFALMDDEPKVAQALLILFADWLVSSLRANRTLTLDVPSRVSGYLFGRSLSHGQTVPDGLSVTLGMSKTDLASHLNTVPETLSRAFKRLTSEGLIEVRGKTVIVHDVGGLARRGEGLLEG